MKRTTEAAFETVIEAHLLENGYVRIAGDAFDRERAIFPNEALAFIRETQPNEWARLERLHGDRTGDQVLGDLCKWMDQHGSLATLRHGFKCYGRTLRVAFFKPAHALNPELEARYAANRLGLTRQLHQEKGYAIKSLVAFSGTVEDDKAPGVTWTEPGMNDGISEKELPERFATQEYRVLLVAEKYQTGFDQPLLHTMYVDKRLAGIQAVQTLSRLNRVHPRKEDTFVLDFVNDREDIREAFKVYYEGAEMGEEVDPARMYAIKGELDASGVYLDEEIERFCAVYFKPRRRQSARDHQAMNAALDSAVSRFATRREEDAEEAEDWRGKVQAFLNLYGFLSQVIPYQDSDLERLYVFLRHLAAKLPRRRSGPAYRFDDEVQLEYYRLQKISEGSISLDEGEARPLDGPTEVGTGLARPQPVPLSQLIDIVNTRFGTEFNQADQLFFDQVVEAAMANDGVRQAAAVNPGDKFELVFKGLLQNLFAERMDQNEDIFVRFMNDEAFQNVVTRWMSSEAYRRLRSNAGSEEDGNVQRAGAQSGDRVLMAYFIDADVLIRAKNLHYGFDFCPAFWDWLVASNEDAVE